MQGRKKHILLILLLLLIAFVSMQMMAGQNYTEEKTRITVILPKDSQNELYGLLDGIRDQAYDEGGYKKNNLLAVTDTMQSEFKYYAATLKSKKEQYRLPVEDSVLEQVRNGEKPFIYVENTYRLGYESMQMLEKKGKTKDMKNICLKPVRLDKERMESGEYDALLSR